MREYSTHGDTIVHHRVHTLRHTLSTLRHTLRIMARLQRSWYTRMGHFEDSACISVQHGMRFDDEWMLAQMMLNATSDAYDDNGDDAQEQHENEQHIPRHPEQTLGVRKEELTSTPRVPVAGGGGEMSERGGGRSERGGGGGDTTRRHWMVQHAINIARHGARERERESQTGARKEGGDSKESPDTTRGPPLVLVSEIELASDELIVF